VTRRDTGRPLIVIPALNEQESIGGVIDEVRRVVPDARLLVVDDGSVDATRETALRAGAAVLSLPFNLGVGAALRAGFRYAVRAGHDVVVQVDGDGQHDPASIPELLAALDTANVVIGARFAGVGDYHVGMARKLAMRLLARSVSRRTQVALTDATSGFRAFDRAAIETFARDYPAEYLGDTVEALVIAGHSGLRVTQIPVVMRPRAGGTPSHRPVRSAVYLARVLLALAISRIRRREPR